MRNFRGIVFIYNTNIYGDFQICISVPLKKRGVHALLTLIFNLFMKLNRRHTMLFKKDTKMGKDTFISLAFLLLSKYFFQNCFQKIRTLFIFQRIFLDTKEL